MKISKIHARQILDSRGNPTVEADLYLEDGSFGRAAVPSGASTGTHEALELRDEDPKSYHGKSVLKAVSNVNTQISQLLVGPEISSQSELDEKILQLDGTESKSNLGANAILAVSLAFAKAVAASQKKPLYQYLHEISQTDKPITLPLPMMNLINGGKHANWSADLQEFMVFPIGAQSFNQAVQMGSELFQTLSKVLKDKGYGTAVGDEGGFAPNVKNGNSEPFDLLSEAIDQSGYKLGQDFVFGLDGAASEFYKDGKYHLKTENLELSTDEMVDWLVKLADKYPIVSMEDCLDQEDWDGWVKLTEKLGHKLQIVGDDLLVTNIKFLQKAIDQKAANTILIKVNQIGTLTETIKAIRLADSANWKSVTSHRSGETEDTTIAHLSVGLGTGQIKPGSMSRTDRLAKYNELLRIEEELGNKAVFAGKDALNR